MRWNVQKAVFYAICAVIGLECLMAAMVVYDCTFIDLDPQPNHQCSTRELRSDIKAMFAEAISSLMAFAMAHKEDDDDSDKRGG